MGYKENKKYIKRCLYGLYVFIYMPWFFTLEHFIQPDMPGIHILNTPLDDKIPFCEYFIIPYISEMVSLKMNSGEKAELLHK